MCILTAGVRPSLDYEVTGIHHEGLSEGRGWEGAEYLAFFLNGTDPYLVQGPLKSIDFRDTQPIRKLTTDNLHKITPCIAEKKRTEP